EVARRPLDDGLHLLFDPHVHRHCERAPTETTNRLGHGLEVLELAAADGDVGARTREFDGDRLADAGAATGDDGAAPFERERGFHDPGQYHSAPAREARPSAGQRDLRLAARHLTIDALPHVPGLEGRAVVRGTRLKLFEERPRVAQTPA